MGGKGGGGARGWGGGGGMGRKGGRGVSETGDCRRCEARAPLLPVGGLVSPTLVGTGVGAAHAPNVPDARAGHATEPQPRASALHRSMEYTAGYEGST
jgi:hypothetical protein